MASIPAPVAEFLAGHRLAVAGLSRAGGQPANAIARKLRDSGHDVVGVNPQASEIDGIACYPDLGAIPGTVDGVMVVTHPSVSAAIVRQAASRNITRIWFRRSVDAGSVSAEALEACREAGITPIVGGCPMMYCEPVDIAHRCMHIVLRWMGRVE